MPTDLTASKLLCLVGLLGLHLGPCAPAVSSESATAVGTVPAGSETTDGWGVMRAATIARREGGDSSAVD